MVGIGAVLCVTLLLVVAGEAGEQLCVHRLRHHGAGGPGSLPGPQRGHPGTGQTHAAQELCLNAVIHAHTH